MLQSTSLNLIGNTNCPGTDIDRVSLPGDYIGSYRRLYRVHLPPNYLRKKNVPLVMVLHGCRQTHEDIQQISGFNAVADRHGFAVVYPFVTHYGDLRNENCWGWWRPQHVKAGSGEVQDLAQMVAQVCDEFPINRYRVYIAGLSSGAGMTVAALTVHRHLFAGGASIAGVAYSETPRAAIPLPFTTRRRYRPTEKIIANMRSARGNDPSLPALMIIHSHNDQTVPIEAAQRLRDSWLGYLYPGHNTSGRCLDSNTIGDTQWMHMRYGRPFRRSKVETVFLYGPGHGWYGGNPGRYSFPDAPNTSEMIWRFLRRHRLNG